MTDFERGFVAGINAAVVELRRQADGWRRPITPSEWTERSADAFDEAADVVEDLAPDVYSKPSTINVEAGGSESIAAAMERSKPLVVDALKLGRSIAGVDESVGRIGDAKAGEACETCNESPCARLYECRSDCGGAGR